MRNPPEYYLCQWMTREEFLTAFAYFFTAMTVPAYGVEHMRSDEFHESFDTLYRGLVWAIRELLDRGFKFQAIFLNTKGDPQLQGQEPIERRNVLLVEKFSTGKIVDPILAINTAFEEMEKQGVYVDRAPMIELRESARADLEEQSADLERNPELREQMDEWTRSQLRAAGDVLRRVKNGDYVPVKRRDEVN